MSSEALLAVLAAATAIYTILPAERRLDLGLRFTIIDWLLISSALLAILYIKYFPVLDALGITIDLGPWRWGFNPDNSSFLIILGATIGIWVHSHFWKLRPAKMRRFLALADELLAVKNYSHLLFLIERHFHTLVYVYAGNFSRARIYRRLLPPQRPIIQEVNGTIRIESPSESRGLAARLKGFCAKPFAKAKIEKEAAQDIIRHALTDDGFVSSLVSIRPYFGLDIVGIAFQERFDFQDLFFRALLQDPHSIVYREIRNTQNLVSMYRYHIPDENRLLTFYLSNPKVAETMRPYKPLGDFALSELNRRKRLRQDDDYNGPLGDFDREGAWRCSIHACIRFFNIMVTEALHHDIRWHMWLYYFPLLAKGIGENANPWPDVELNREWPTPYHFLIYQLFQAMSGWLGESSTLPPARWDALVTNDNTEHQNDSIPKSTALALGQSLKYCLLCNRLDSRFDAYILEIALNRLKELASQSKTARLASVLARSIKRGGDSSRGNAQYEEALRCALRKTDPILRAEIRDTVELGSLIRATFDSQVD